jgi:Mn2+/Fe2+ NRAMP family transporter
MTVWQRFKPLRVRLLVLLAILGPGLITASADNDAPGIATYSMAGSAYGYRFLWVILAITVGEVIVMEMAGRMGAVTGKGTADLIREQFGVRVTVFAMVCLLIANLGTTIGEFAGVAAGTELFGLPRYISVPLVALLVGLLVIRGSYRHVEKVLLALTLAALSYIITAFIEHPNWGEVLRQAITPTLQGGTDYLLALLAVAGTTITPWGIVYMQASVVDKGIALDEYKYSRLDVVTGSVWGNIVSAFIVICTAVRLFAAGIRVETADQAAMALEPLAGVWAKGLFAVGLLAASLLAASVLPLSTAYAVSEAFGWERGLDRPVREAHIFYGLYIGIIVLGVAIVLIPGVPLFPLMWFSQSVNAILLPVLLVLVLSLANDKRLMGRWTNSRLQNVLAWVLTGLIILTTVFLFASPLMS